MGISIYCSFFEEKCGWSLLSPVSERCFAFVLVWFNRMPDSIHRQILWYLSRFWCPALLLGSLIQMVEIIECLKIWGELHCTWLSSPHPHTQGYMTLALSGVSSLLVTVWLPDIQDCCSSPGTFLSISFSFSKVSSQTLTDWTPVLAHLSLLKYQQSPTRVTPNSTYWRWNLKNYQKGI